MGFSSSALLLFYDCQHNCVATLPQRHYIVYSVMRVTDNLLQADCNFSFGFLTDTDSPVHVAFKWLLFTFILCAEANRASSVQYIPLPCVKLRPSISFQSLVSVLLLHAGPFACCLEFAVVAVQLQHCAVQSQATTGGCMT
jgi:hypothetical protein